MGPWGPGLRNIGLHSSHCGCTVSKTAVVLRLLTLIRLFYFVFEGINVTQRSFKSLPLRLAVPPLG